MHLIKNSWVVGQEGKKDLRMDTVLWAETRYMQNTCRRAITLIDENAESSVTNEFTTAGFWTKGSVK